MDKQKSFRLGTAVLLIISVLFFFLVYASIGHAGYSGFKLITSLYSELGFNELFFELILDYLLPVLLTVIAGLILLSKPSTAKYVVASLMNIGAVILYSYIFSTTSRTFSGAGIGLKANYIIAILGVALPIVLLVLSVIDERKSSMVSCTRTC